jgi:hypothetical protein
MNELGLKFIYKARKSDPHEDLAISRDDQEECESSD